MGESTLRTCDEHQHGLARYVERARLLTEETAAPPPPPHFAPNGQEVEISHGGARETVKRGRGFTTNGGPPSAVALPPRPLRALSTRSPEGTNPFEKPVDRALSAVRLHSRHIPSPSETALPRPENINGSNRTILATSPDGLSPSRDAGYLFETTTVSDSVNGGKPAPTASVSAIQNPLRRITTTDSVDGSNAATLAGAEVVKGEGRATRLNRHSLRKDLSPRSDSRRPSNTPADIHTVGDFAQEHLFTSVSLSWQVPRPS